MSMYLVDNDTHIISVIRKTFLALMLSVSSAAFAEANLAGHRLTQSDERAVLWWVSSGWKVRPDEPVPDEKSDSMLVRAARNEAEAVQLVVRPKSDLAWFSVRIEDLVKPGGVIKSSDIDILRVRYVTTVMATDPSAAPGQWPDPLPPFSRPITLKADRNQPLWMRVKPPPGTPAGRYKADIILSGQDYSQRVPLTVEVYDFTLPNRMSLKTSFGFMPENVWRYQNIRTSADKRMVLEEYWANMAAHHISPYDPAPLDKIRTIWPKVKPPPSKFADWYNIRVVGNETHSGSGAMLLYDDNPELSVTTAYRPLIRIPANGLRLQFWYRTAIPEHRFLVTLEHYDRNGKWISGHNNDMVINGSGRWERFDHTITRYPKYTHSVKLKLRAAKWTRDGSLMGLVWMDDLSITNAKTGESFIARGDFEQQKRTQPVVPAQYLQPRMDFSAWDRAMARGIDHYNFNSVRLSVPGLRGDTKEGVMVPKLRGFTEQDPEYSILFDSYCRQLQAHLAQMGWLDEAFIYWFDEPSPDQYAFVKRGFDKLKKSCPGIGRMLTEQPEEPLYGGPNIYCVRSDLYDHTVAEKRRSEGDRFWWYICTGPKAPYCTLFIDHAATELRVWLWQAWKHDIEGILIWRSNYWTSSSAYPNTAQNPYEDPMSWVSGHGASPGAKRPWGNGDGRFIYPPEAAACANPPVAVLEGPVDSIRWEMLRDGIEDYEYLAILKRLLAAKKNSLSAQEYKEYSSLLDVPETITRDMTHFTKNPEQIESQRHKVARAIETLDRL